MARQWQLTMYVHDTAGQTAFWSQALGYVEQPPPPGYDSWEDLLREMGMPEERFDEGGAIVDPDDRGPRIFFHKVPEDKPDQMNRLHLDIRVTDGDGDEQDRRAAQRTEAARLVELGASEVGPVEDMGEFWIVMRDPEGNEFCIT